MQLRCLELHDFRCFDRARLDLPDGVTLLAGGNAQGKTSLLEAAQRIATGSSHRVGGDSALVRQGCGQAVVRAVVQTDAGRRRSVELEIGEGRTRTRVDGRAASRVGDAVGVLRTVLFAPEDVALVRGGPARRRGFLDELLVQRRPAYAAAIGEFRRVLRQRNRLLRQLSTLGGPARQRAGDTLQTWTEHLVRHAVQVTAARLAAVHALAGPLRRHYRSLAGERGGIGLTYRGGSGWGVEADSGAGVPDRAAVEARLREGLREVRAREEDRGLTLVGPHRDDLEMSVGGLTAREHASQGEVWSLALALRLASWEVLAEVGDRPVVLLDDVFAELDTDRRARLAEACRGWDQVLVTAAVPEDVPLAAHRVRVVREDEVSRLVHPAAGPIGGVA